MIAFSCFAVAGFAEGFNAVEFAEDLRRFLGACETETFTAIDFAGFNTVDLLGGLIDLAFDLGLAENFNTDFDFALLTTFLFDLRFFLFALQFLVSMLDSDVADT